jgi:hypothetical protein
VQREVCRIFAPPLAETQEWMYEIEKGQLKESTVDGVPRTIEPDRLCLPLVSALPAFRPVYDGLSRLGFYNLNPERIRELQDPDPGELLARDGRNISVLRRLKEESPENLGRIVEYLRAIVPGVHDLRPQTVLNKETIEFDQEVAGSRYPWHFPAAGMSDGTLRALGVLVAVFQDSGKATRRAIPLIGIEEPEAAIHPGAAVKLMDALLEAQRRTQVVVTTHSPDLLDHPALEPEQILAVEARAGTTVMGPTNPASRQAMRDRLYSAGELLRLAHLSPSEESFSASARQLDLFAPDRDAG